MIISQSTDIPWRTAAWSPFQMKKIKLPRYKTISTDSPENFLRRQYSELTTQSVKKNYGLNNLRPYQVTDAVQKLKKEVDSLEVISPTHNFSLDQKQNLRSQLATIVAKAKISKDDLSETKAKKFVTSLIDNQQMELMEDYQGQMKQRNQLQKQIIQKINRKQFQQYAIGESERNRWKKFMKKKIFRLNDMKSQKVSRQYREQSNKNLPLKRNPLKDYDKNDICVFSRSKKRSYNVKFPNRHSLIELQCKQLGVSKQLFSSFLHSYTKRRQILSTKK